MAGRLLESSASHLEDLSSHKSATLVRTTQNNDWQLHLLKITVSDYTVFHEVRFLFEDLHRTFLISMICCLSAIYPEVQASSHAVFLNWGYADPQGSASGC